MNARLRLIFDRFLSKKGEPRAMHDVYDLLIKSVKNFCRWVFHEIILNFFWNVYEDMDTRHRAACESNGFARMLRFVHTHVWIWSLFWFHFFAWSVVIRFFAHLFLGDWLFFNLKTIVVFNFNHVHYFSVKRRSVSICLCHSRQCRCFDSDEYKNVVSWAFEKIGLQNWTG